jgi:hypothetical protein
MTPTRRRALDILHVAGRNGVDAGSFGADLWRDIERRGRISSSNGGGDYAAQCFFGKLRKAGLVEYAPSEGSTLWRLTPAGEAARSES